MATSAHQQSPAADRQWFIVGRWQEYAGEGRANLLRIIAVGAFYIVQLVNYELLDAANKEANRNFHQAATALAVAWAMLALGVMLCLRRQIFPAGLKFVSTGCDIVLLTGLATIGAGPASPLVFVYFLIVAMAGLRFSLRLVWCASIGCMVGYLALVGIKDPTWFDAQHETRPVEQLIVLLSLALSGVMVGQMIRRARALADDYARRLEASQKGNT